LFLGAWALAGKSAGAQFAASRRPIVDDFTPRRLVNSPGRSPERDSQMTRRVIPSPLYRNRPKPMSMRRLKISETDDAAGKLKLARMKKSKLISE
jgi:hypothetical protein